MKKVALPLLMVTVVGLLLGGLIVGFRGSGTAQAQVPPPPTPKGQLGGAPRLTPLIGAEASVTPVPPTGTPVSTAVDTCAIAPRSLQDVAQLIQATPVEAGNAGVAAVGIPADAAIVAGVTETVAGFVTCLNDGDQLRALAYMTDDAVRQSLAATGWDAGAVAEHLQNVQPRSADQQLRVRAISDVSQLPDGRVVATVELADPVRFPLTISAEQWVFTQEPSGGRWLIDRAR